ncbi:potassium channel family protein [Kaistella palustris]|uniref:potassium channel family protein n=1 Tax=Kaistella palustris TaxID=493376 RepID=UPI00041634E9|nr:potassium channel family protein [Kaistella palustris]
MLYSAFRAFFREQRYRNLTLTTVGVLLVGILGYRFLEGWRWIDCVNYAVSTMVTTGNTEIYPKSDWGKVFNIFYMFLSVILILIFVNTLHQHFHDLRLRREIKHKRHHEIVERQMKSQEESAE